MSILVGASGNSGEILNWKCHVTSVSNEFMLATHRQGRPFCLFIIYILRSKEPSLTSGLSNRGKKSTWCRGQAEIMLTNNKKLVQVLRVERGKKKQLT